MATNIVYHNLFRKLWFLVCLVDECPIFIWICRLADIVNIHNCWYILTVDQSVHHLYYNIRNSHLLVHSDRRSKCTSLLLHYQIFTSVGTSWPWINLYITSLLIGDIHNCWYILIADQFVHHFYHNIRYPQLLVHIDHGSICTSLLF